MRLGIRSGGGRGLVACVFKEPFVHFILLGVTMFAAGHYLDARSQLTRITITQDQIHRLSDNYRLQYGEDASPEQLGRLVDGAIKDEMFYREALKLGLDENDEIIRRRLIQKYEFLQQDLAILAEPARAQLLEYYHEHADRYRWPETTSFSHVYFSPDRRRESETQRVAQEMAAHLNRQGRGEGSDHGDRFPGSSNFTAVSRDDVGRVFGREYFTEVVFNAEPGRWTGPVRSGLGWHLVYISDHEPPRQIPFDEAHDEVRRDYLETERERRNAELIEELRQRFRIVHD